LSLFVDGGVADTQSTSAAVTANTVPLIFGANLVPTATYLQGRLDEVRISSVARYTSTFTPAVRHTVDGSTIGLWHFDEGSGSTVADSAGGHTGTLVGDTTFTLR
jgi:L-lactate permease